MKTVKVEVTKEVSDFIKGNGQIILTPIGEKDEHGEEYYFIPFWFKKTDNPNVFEQYRLGDDLPIDLISAIKATRETPIDICSECGDVYPRLYSDNTWHCDECGNIWPNEE